MDEASLAGLAILVVEDELLLRKQIAGTLERLGADVTLAGSIQAARSFLKNLDFDFALLDVNLPDGLGTDLLRDHSFPANVSVIVMTAHGGVSGAVEAMRLGAVDYLTKPFEPAELPLVFNRARRSRQTARLEEHVRSDAPEFFFGCALSAIELQLQKILGADRRVHGRLAPVLICGETGTGKTTIARWLHRNGPRSSQPLVEVNCSALPDTLAESELFGHERGAFTDARAARIGLFEAAHHGTLFLDELPSLSLPLQAKILTAIEDGTIRRLGSNKAISVDVRIIAASQRPLKSLVEQGSFREDLAHRLDLFRVEIPPLRDRGADIPVLAGLLIGQLCRRHRVSRKQISPCGRQRLLAHRWPGNVRELAHEIERAIVFEDAAELEFSHLQLARPAGSRPVLSQDEWFNESFRIPEQGFLLEKAINHLIQHALKQTGGNVSAAARLLGVSRDYLRYRLDNPGAQEHQSGE